MKVVLVNYRYFITSGPETFLFKFKALLEQKGHTVIPFSTINSQNIPDFYSKYFAMGRSSEGEVLFSKIKKTPGNLFRLFCGAFFNFDAFSKLRKLIKDEHPDIIFVLQEMNALSPSIFKAAAMEKIPVLYRQSDFHLVCPNFKCMNNNGTCIECIEKQSFRPAIKNKCVEGSRFVSLVRCLSMQFHNQLKLYDTISAFIVPTQFTANLLAKGGIPSHKIVRIPTFIDCSEIIPSYTDDGESVVFFGRVVEEKGVDDLIRAVAVAKNRNFKVKIIGKGKEEYILKLKRLAEEQSVSDRIIFTGLMNRDRLSEEINKAAFSVIPNRWFENMPNSVLESFAHAKPVICSDIGCMPEIVEDNKTGFLYSHGNIEELSEKIDLLINDIEKRKAMGRYARTVCETLYGPDLFYERIMNLFTRVMAP